MTYRLVRAAFAILFVGVRIVLWFWCSLHYWRDIVWIVPTLDSWESARVCFMLTGNLILTILQLIWGSLVAKGVLLTLGLVEKTKHA
jgi:hypothetical protein